MGQWNQSKAMFYLAAGIVAAIVLAVVIPSITCAVLSFMKGESACGETTRGDIKDAMFELLAVALTLISGIVGYSLGRGKNGKNGKTNGHGNQ